MKTYDAASKSDVDRLTCQGQICENHSMAKLAGGVLRRNRTIILEICAVK